jgi:hypothetical protein
MHVRLGRSGWYFCAWCDPPPEEEDCLQFRGSETDAQQWLGRFRHDPFAMNDLHALWLRTSNERLTDDQLVQMLSWWLRTGRIRAYHPWMEIQGGGMDESQPSPAPAPRQATSTSPPPTSESATLPPDADAGGIAAAQRDAADDGTPFCEECARAAAAAQA